MELYIVKNNSTTFAIACDNEGRLSGAFICREGKVIVSPNWDVMSTTMGSLFGKPVQDLVLISRASKMGHIVINTLCVQGATAKSLSSTLAQEMPVGGYGMMCWMLGEDHPARALTDLLKEYHHVGYVRQEHQQVINEVVANLLTQWEKENETVSR